MSFWQTVRSQLNALATAETAADVIRILNEGNASDPEVSSYTGFLSTGVDAFFAGGGGDENVLDILRWDNPNWESVDIRAPYYGCVRSRVDGSLITYVEGDVYIGNKMPVGPTKEDM